MLIDEADALEEELLGGALADSAAADESHESLMATRGVPFVRNDELLRVRIYSYTTFTFIRFWLCKPDMLDNAGLQQKTIHSAIYNRSLDTGTR